MSNIDDYPFIRLWGKQLGSSTYYINDQVAQARQDGAPQNAIYERGGEWKTTDDITSDSTRRDLGLDPLPITVDNIGKVIHGDATPDGNPVRRGKNWVIRLSFADATRAIQFAKYLDGKVKEVDLAEPLASISDPAVLEVVFLEQE